MTETLKTDLYDIVSDTNIPWDKLKDSVILITGATGLIGGMLIRALSEANKQRCLNLQIIACGRNREIGDKLTQVTDANFIYHDIRNSSLLTEITGSIDYIIHCAAITKSADMVARPVDVMTTEVNGTQSILRLAQEKGCRSVVYLSSMEVYGQGLSGNIDETNLGYIDLSNPRSCYPVSKRFCEMMCISYTVQHNIPVKIARLAQTFGAGTPQNDTRVFAQFARSSINGENIILHTDGKSRGNYCYTSDTVRGLLTILTKGENSATY
ncbi:MAG: NAD-dependent epimerase/dehydratase family protein, partial [Oscillospiraceae bacterium]|nr:NAD-dependent epimerase/dehydratase family protein [Oscillospiraceae bacterium]